MRAVLQPLAKSGMVQLGDLLLSLFHRAILLAWASASILRASVPPLKYTASLGDGANIAVIAVDASGYVYVTGYASSALPVTPGAFQTEYKPAKCYVGAGMSQRQ